MSPIEQARRPTVDLGRLESEVAIEQARRPAVDLGRLESEVSGVLPDLPSHPEAEPFSQEGPFSLEASFSQERPFSQDEPFPQAEPPVRSGAMPYIKHQEGISRVGALTAEAVLRDYEAAAREIEAMGEELISAARKCEEMTAQVHDALAYTRDTAAAYREEAKKIFRRIEDCAMLTEHVRKTCETLKQKIEGNDYLGGAWPPGGLPR